MEQVEVLEENVEYLDHFLDFMDASRVGPMGGWMGLDRPSMESTLRMLKIDDTSRVYAAVRTIEKAASAEYNRLRRIDEAKQKSGGGHAG